MHKNIKILMTVLGHHTNAIKTVLFCLRIQLGTIKQRAKNLMYVGGKRIWGNGDASFFEVRS